MTAEGTVVAREITFVVCPGESHRNLDSFPTRRSSDLRQGRGHRDQGAEEPAGQAREGPAVRTGRSEEHTSELQSRGHLVCRLLLEKKENHARTDGGNRDKSCRNNESREGNNHKQDDNV